MSTIGHTRTVETFFELVRDAETVSWMAEDRSPVDLGERLPGIPSVVRGTKVGGRYGDYAGQVFFPESIEDPVLDVFVDKSAGEEKAVLGVYETRFPIVKMIQLQVGYDLLANEDGVIPEAEFRVKIESRSGPGEEWVEDTVIARGQDDSPLQGSGESVHEAHGERFSTRTMFAELTDWCGKYVRLTFEMDFDVTASGPCRARILEARLVRSDVRVVLVGEPESVLFAPGLGVMGKSGKKDPSSFSEYRGSLPVKELLQSATAYFYSDVIEDVTIGNFRDYPEGGLPMQRFRCLFGKRFS